MYRLVQLESFVALFKPRIPGQFLPRELNSGRHPWSVASLARPMVSEAHDDMGPLRRSGSVAHALWNGTAPALDPTGLTSEATLRGLRSRKTACKRAQSIESPARLNGIGLSIPSPNGLMSGGDQPSPINIIYVRY
jgi:hypothetical protein